MRLRYGDSGDMCRLRHNFVKILIYSKWLRSQHVLTVSQLAALKGLDYTLFVPVASSSQGSIALMSENTEGSPVTRHLSWSGDEGERSSVSQLSRPVSQNLSLPLLIRGDPASF